MYSFTFFICFLFLPPRLAGSIFAPLFLFPQSGKGILLLIFSLLSAFSLCFLVFPFEGFFCLDFRCFSYLIFVVFGGVFCPFPPLPNACGKRVDKKKGKRGRNADRQRDREEKCKLLITFLDKRIF